MSSPELENANKILNRNPKTGLPYPSSRTADKFVIRLPDGMRPIVAQAARGHKRSMNSQIIHVLEMHIQLEAMGHGPMLAALLDEEAPQPAAAPVSSFHLGDPVGFNGSNWIVSKIHVRTNIVYADLERESPANGLPETTTARYSQLKAAILA